MPPAGCAQETKEGVRRWATPLACLVSPRCAAADCFSTATAQRDCNPRAAQHAGRAPSKQSSNRHAPRHCARAASSTTPHLVVAPVHVVQQRIPLQLCHHRQQRVASLCEGGADPCEGHACAAACCRTHRMHSPPTARRQGWRVVVATGRLGKCSRHEVNNEALMLCCAPCGVGGERARSQLETIPCPAARM